ncbi:Protein kinase of the Mitotic Exit Network, partial [Coemansia sp. RSA 2611]
MENIGNFLSAAQSLGLDSSDLFQTVDLYEGKNMPRVIMTLLAIARVVAGIPLNSHRKISDAHRTLGDGWNSSTLTDRDGMPLATPPADYISMRNQPTLVNAAEQAARPATVAACEAVGGSTSLRTRGLASPHSSLSVNSSRHERRRSKRRSAATLFTANTEKAGPLAPIEAVASDESAELDCADLAPVCLPSDNGYNSSDSASTHATKEPAMLVTPPASAKAMLKSPGEANIEAAPAPRPQKRTLTKTRPKERLTVYSESAQRHTSYQLGNCIGRGQFGAVYRALDLETGEMVAVKQIPLEGQDADSMDDVMQEVELLKSLSNPRIVRYYGFVKTDTHLNLAMEYVENGSLSATLKSFGAFPERLVLAYVVKIIEGLVYLHSGDVVHCDLKACNILTTKNGNTKLTDFGVSLNLKLRRPGDESVVAGTPYWMAPEVIQLEGACTASDIWSLGCTIIELLTGKPPYSGMLQMAALYRIVEDEHPPIPDGISEELKDFLLQCFRKDPSDRPTAVQLKEHPWTLQYRRNRKEMKLLRRTCSRKMSSYIARKRTARDYPAFNPTQLKPIVAAQRTPEGANGDAESWEEADEAQRLGEPVCQQIGATPEPGTPPTLVESRHARDEPAQAAAVEDEPDGLPAAAPESPVAADASGVQNNAPSAIASGEDTDASISTFEGPRLKRHRLRAILCDTNSVCAVCSRTLSGTFIQCTSCKIRCHDACTQHLQPCSAMRMSRFLYPASRKSSKRYESKAPKLRLRPDRKGTLRRQHGRYPATQAEMSASAADIFGSTCGSYAGGLLGSSDGSLHMSNLRASVADSPLGMVNDGFDGFIDVETPMTRPASIAGATSLPVNDGQSPMYGSGRHWADAADRRSMHAADSGWETDETTAAFSQGSHSFKADKRARSGVLVASISIPHAKNGAGPYSAPLAAGSASAAAMPIGDRGTAHEPLYYQPLAGNSAQALPPRVGSITPLSQ